MSDIKTFSGVGKRISLLRKEKNLSQEAFAGQIDRSRSYLAGIESEKQEPSFDFIMQIVDNFDVDTNWLLKGVVLNNDRNGYDLGDAEYVQIQRYAVSASAGQGAINNEDELGTGWYAFNKKWLEKRSLKPNNLSVIAVRGDSMEPKLSDKDLVLIDHAQNLAIDGFIYSIRIGNELYVKSIQKRGDDTIYMVSANPEYPPFSIDTCADAQIIGRVVASMHEW